MKLITFCFAFILSGHLSFSQDSVKPKRSCSDLLDEVSYFWKLDSLANNGFRLYSYKQLLNCKSDSISKSILLDKLGKPNKISSTNHGIDYVYFVYDTKALPKEFGGPSVVSFIVFRFGTYEKFVTSIYESHGDY